MENQPITSARQTAKMGDKNNDLTCNRFLSRHQPINKPVVITIMVNTPIAKGNKLVKNRVPENQLAE